MWSVAVLTGPRLSGIQRDVDDTFFDKLVKKLHISDEVGSTLHLLFVVCISHFRQKACYEKLMTDQTYKLKSGSKD